MAAKNSFDLERLLDQVLLNNPKLSYKENLSSVAQKLEEQLVQQCAVVRLEPLECQFKTLTEDVSQRIHELKNLLEESGGEKTGGKNHSKKDNNCVKLERYYNLSDSSDDEALSLKITRTRHRKSKRESVFDVSDNSCDGNKSADGKLKHLPLALQRTPRKRIRSSNFKFVSHSPKKSLVNSQAGNTHASRKCSGKQDAAVSSSIIHHSEDEEEEEVVPSRLFDLKVPFSFRNIINRLDFCNVDMVRKAVDVSAKEARHKLAESAATKTHKQQQTHLVQEQTGTYDEEISQLLNDVIGSSANEDETWQATRALENINHEIIDNYDVMPSCSSKAPALQAIENGKAPKRRYKSATTQPQGEKKKRGRKPKNALPAVSPPTKSNLAQYVENFSNEYNMQGSATPGASSTVSQPMVSSTTQHFEYIDEQGGQPSIMYYFDADGQFRIATATDNAEIPPQNLAEPMQQNALDINSLPIITQMRQPIDLQNTLVSPIVQIPSLSNRATSLIVPGRADRLAPPPAHSTCGVLDLSVKSNPNISNSSAELNNYTIQQTSPLEYNISFGANDNEAMPLDLSATSTFNKQNIGNTSPSYVEDIQQTEDMTDDGQDDDFIRRLIETSDFDLGLDALHGETCVDKSFKAALDMPILETIGNNDESGALLKDSNKSLANDSSYVSMEETSPPNNLNFTLSDGYRFVDDGSKEIFEKLLDIDGAVTETCNLTDGNNLANILSLDEKDYCGSIPQSSQEIVIEIQDSDSNKFNVITKLNETSMQQNDDAIRDKNHENNSTIVKKPLTNNIVLTDNVNKSERALDKAGSLMEVVDTNLKKPKDRILYNNIKITSQSEKFKTREHLHHISKYGQLEAESYVISECSTRISRRRLTLDKTNDLGTCNESSFTQVEKSVTNHGLRKICNRRSTFVEKHNTIEGLPKILKRRHTLTKFIDLEEITPNLAESNELFNIKNVTKVLVSKATINDNICKSRMQVDVYEVDVCAGSSENSNDAKSSNDEIISSSESIDNEEQTDDVVKFNAEHKSDEKDLCKANMGQEFECSISENVVDETPESDILIASSVSILDVDMKECSDPVIICEANNENKAESSIPNHEATQNLTENVVVEKPVTGELTDYVAKNNLEATQNNSKNILVEKPVLNKLTDSRTNILQMENDQISPTSLIENICETERSSPVIIICEANNRNEVEGPIKELEAMHNNAKEITANKSVLNIVTESNVSSFNVDSLTEEILESDHLNYSDNNDNNNDSIINLSAKDSSLYTTNTKQKQKSPDKSFISCINNDQCESIPNKREKIVFSIAKIKLNYDKSCIDDIFLSDSDNNSGKSSEERFEASNTLAADTEMQLQAEDLTVKSERNEAELLQNADDKSSQAEIDLYNFDAKTNHPIIMDISINDCTKSQCSQERLLELMTEDLNCYSPSGVTKTEYPREMFEGSSINVDNSKKTLQVDKAKHSSAKPIEFSCILENEVEIHTDDHQDKCVLDKKIEKSVRVKRPSLDLQMSALEMEALVDDELDFEDDDMDAISLNTSSISDSPKSDRFADSLLNEMEDNEMHTATLITQTVDSYQSILNELEDNVPLITQTADNYNTSVSMKIEVPKLPSIDNMLNRDFSKPPPLINFKIPKLNSSATSCYSKAKTKPNRIKCAKVANIYAKKMQPFVKLEKINIPLGTRINVKQFKEMINLIKDRKQQKPKKYENITRTITNETTSIQHGTTVARKPSTEQALQLKPNFKTTFNNFTVTINKGQKISAGTSQSLQGIQKPAPQQIMLQSLPAVQQSVQRIQPILQGPTIQQTVQPFPIKQDVKCLFNNNKDQTISAGTSQSLQGIQKPGPQKIILQSLPAVQQTVQRIQPILLGQPIQQTVQPLPIKQDVKCLFNNSKALVIQKDKPVAVNLNINPVPRISGTGFNIPEIAGIFGATCLPSLVNKCHATPNNPCTNSHIFNNNETVLAALNSLNKMQLLAAYNFMCRHFILFNAYFALFCKLYAMRQDRSKLLTMIYDCERYEQCAEYIIMIYESLVDSGLSRTNACRHLLKRSRNKSIQVIDALVAIIMKSDWTLFTDQIESYTHEIYKYKFRLTVVEQMASTILNDKQARLKEVFFKCVQMLHCDDVALLPSSAVLMQCLALLSETL